jgi:predicted CopG family antitoxin
LARRMANLNISISDELYKKLKLEIVKRLGGRKGDLKEAVEEAIKLWLQSPQP